MRFFPLSSTEKRSSVLRSHFLTKMLTIFRNYYSKYEESNAVFHFFYKCVIVTVEKIDDRWSQYRQLKTAQKGGDCLMRPNLT